MFIYFAKRSTIDIRLDFIYASVLNMFKIRNEYARMMSVGCFAVLMINFELFRRNPVRDKSKNNLDFDPNTFSLVSQNLQSEPSAKSNLSQ